MNLNTSGKWAGEHDNTEEQVQALNILDDYIDFDNSYTYTEKDIQNTNANIARVIGFWMEEAPTRSGHTFVVYMQLENDTVELKFGLERESVFTNRNAILIEFLKIFGVDSSNIQDIIGRKAIYEDRRDENTERHQYGLNFYNSRRTRLSLMSQKLSLYTLLAGTLSLIPLSAISENMAFISIAIIIVGLFIASIDVFRRRYDRHTTISLKNYQIESNPN